MVRKARRDPALAQPVQVAQAPAPADQVGPGLARVVQALGADWER